MTNNRPIVAYQPFTVGGVARFSVASLWRLLGVQFIFAFFVAGVFVWFVNSAWIPVIDESIEQMPPSGDISLGSLNWPVGASLHVEGPAGGEPFMRLDVEPGGITNVIESVDLVLAFESKRLFVGSSLGLGLIVLPYPLNLKIPFNKSDLKPWWGARSHLVLLSLGFLIAVLLIVSWSFLGCLYILPLKIFSINRLSVRGAWQLASAAHMPGALLMSVGIFMYGIKQIELVVFAFVWGIHLMIPWFYLFFSPFFTPKPTKKVRKIKSEAKFSEAGNPFHQSSNKNKSNNPFDK